MCLNVQNTNIYHKLIEIIYGHMNEDSSYCETHLVCSNFVYTMLIISVLYRTLYENYMRQKVATTV